jgi:hypothetical protein
MHAVQKLMPPSRVEYFPKAERVLALYPDTTTFYGASVVTSPTETRDYMVHFDGVRGVQATHTRTPPSLLFTQLL